MDKLLEEIKSRTKNNPIRSKELEKKYLLSGSQIRDKVREYRRSGLPVCMVSEKDAHTGGYFYSTEPRDIADMRQNLLNRIASLEKTLRDFDNKFAGDKQSKMF